MPHDIILEETELCGDEQYDGRVSRDVFDDEATPALASNSGTLDFARNTTVWCDLVAARGSPQRSGVDKVKALAIRTLWLQEVLKEVELQNKSVTSKANRDEGSPRSTAASIEWSLWGRNAWRSETRVD